jgi:hypothetical protein
VAYDFKVLQAKHLRKINAQRRALSQPAVKSVPTLSSGEVLFMAASKMGGEPANCYNCPMYNYELSCMLMGPNVKIRKFIYPPKATADAKRIEYWPHCSYWRRGKPNYGPAAYDENLKTPDEVNLGWINAPEVGLETSGANCNGRDGGDDCDRYVQEAAEPRDEPSGFCRVMQMQVEGGAHCAAWADDDFVNYEQGSVLLRELDGE